ncbi:AF4/FMR2 family member 4 isoform X1 [Poecilia latipinna]|uniref:AF4/FMR2 family member 4 isoform X1 n=1 Tax=Poecilia latipinna TaxID=48699 RepID=UPI00072DBCC0|nr:PREDICTED: AF4/FMR2 family member 4-like isoform X1 [Poecilia latipinna]
MASQPSAHNEERNLLRRRAWEQRVQETSQTKELDAENAPLFAEPYKKKTGGAPGRIQRMLGSYEDVNNPVPPSLEVLPIPSYVSLSQSDQSQPVAEQSNKTLSRSQDLHMSTTQQSQKGTSNCVYSSSPNYRGHSSRFPATSSTHSQSSRLGHHIKESEVFPDLRGAVGLPQEVSAPSPDAKPLPVLHSCDHNANTDTRDTFKRDQLQGSPDLSSGLTGSVSVFTLNSRLSPINPPPPQAKTNALPSQTFPSLLSSKQAGMVMTQKPTAYVRPMDGQDQVVQKSPELKPSPEHYAPLPELINKTDIAKTMKVPQFFEAPSDEVLCVEDILREMTRPWPPLLTAIHTPTYEPSKSPVPAKEAEQVSSCPEQKSLEFSSKDSSHFNRLNSSNSLEATHSSDAEMRSSSDSSLESDSDISIKEPPKPTESKLIEIEPDAPTASDRDWELGERVGSHLQTFSTGRQTPKQTSADASEESKAFSQQRALTDNMAATQQSSESIQDASFCQNNSKTSCSDGGRHSSSSSSSSKRLSKPSAAGGPNRTEAALGVKSEELATPKMEQHFTDNPKVKSKTTEHKKDTKRDAKRSKYAKHKKAGSEVAPGLHSRCPTCGVQYPKSCCCSAQSPAQPAAPVRVSCPKTNTETEVPHKSTHKHSHKASEAAKGWWDQHQPPKSLLVRIDIGLLSRVPLKSSNNKGISSNAKRPALAIEKDEASRESSKAHRPGKSNKKSQNVETKSPPKKKLKLENKNTSLSRASVRVESSNKPDKEQKKAKKTSQDLATSKDATKAPKVQNPCSAMVLKTSKENAKGKDSNKHKTIKGKHPQPSLHKKCQAKTPKSGLDVPSTLKPQRGAVSNRSLLHFDKRQYPVNHYIKEAKKLKHKADAEQDKLSKAFTYLEAAMFFVESGIAMEKDPQISGSSYTMLAETVELLKFVLKLKNPVDSSASPPENDFLALCLKCQSLLHMAMFRHKQKAATKFSKTLTDHFQNFAQVSRKQPSSAKLAENPSPGVPSPASTSSGTGSNHSGSADGSTVLIPQDIEQVAFSYVNITTLFLSAHDIWEQAEELALKGSGVLAELDASMGPLSLMSNMSFMVRYVRQGVNWLRLDSRKL